ncbi:MAG: SUMF1/EgtB/PvdO family nonheme iron enzyme [Verrucomicrobia bacterium]|jgi:formylglycine-generating enzyme required for sulfatase activity|nr:SUMF1/EgtB/PvdO family nonheme iron enzyme [Verrucomicrobiota bacterium]MBT7066406.1 SUMF1/EgtB/PvdO family nonheme iron enzyme [Verrucomicrobiota bacterium]MBT7701282.1 SUMF1/EgtB/PvdO family nonheme iron enzyme [Verrucomicrobiota bacterium]
MYGERGMKTMRLLTAILVSVAFCMAGHPTDASAAPDGALLERYTGMLNKLRTELTAKVPPNAPADATVNRFLASDALDAKLVTYVVLHEATPQGLAAFAQQGRAQAMLVEKMLADTDLMKQMLVADGAKPKREGRGVGPAQVGPAMKIYSDIQKASRRARSGVLQRLALAIALEHAVPIGQRNPTALTDAPATVDPVKRYLSYEKAYLAGELDPAFERLSTWDLRFVVDGNEPDATLAWGREMLRNFRPDHIYNPNYGWRYVSAVASDVRYGSGDVKYDRPELQFFQNILMNGGVCGRRAFFGRFILRSFGMPTTARPQRGHAALVHWTPKGWVANLGGGWGCGWTKTVYNKDKDFLASTQARANSKAYLKVKRAQWVGDVMGEKRTYGEGAGTPAFWNGVSLKTQRSIIKESKAQTLAALGEELGESSETLAEKVMASPVTPEDKKISYGRDGSIVIPAAAYSKPSGNTRDVIAMKSFEGGLQVFLPRFGRKGVTTLRGGAWRGGADSCRSGWRMPSSGYGRYNNWGFRAAMDAAGSKGPRELKCDLGDGVTIEFVYIKPGTFTMGGTNTKDGKWHGVEVPKHQVTITKGFYMGKYEVTQAQFQKLMGSNPSKAIKDPNCPADTISEGDAVAFCNKLAERTGKATRLPTEAEWEHACRAGTKTKYFFGDDPSTLGDYAWFDQNDGGTSHPVGQKKPNPWGLYDICGNVCERVSDIYAKDYYAKSPKEDPTGPSQGVKSRMEYEVAVPQAGRYMFNAQVVTANYDQKLNVSANDSTSEIAMVMPFTVGSWKACEPVVLDLKKGKNVLRFSRTNPPQYGLAIKSFTLKPRR